MRARLARGRRREKYRATPSALAGAIPSARGERTGTIARMGKRKLPIGIQTFRQIREEGYYYVDKTAYYARRIEDDAGKHYFLSRPRRFGKSLFVDTLKELYEGRETLFRGLAVHDGWDWSRRHPVVRLSFGGGNFRRPGVLAESATTQLEDIGRRAGVVARSGGAPGRRRLLEALSERAGRRVVVLVDEYDKPILDALDEPDIARTNRDDLRGLYGTIKDCDAFVELTFITGVSRFSRVSLFSDLNNLIDLTVDPDYSAICGYTEVDLDVVFAPELPGLDRDEIRAWYNGYSWLGAETVYNPFALLKLFRSREWTRWRRAGGRRTTAARCGGCWRRRTGQATRRCSSGCWQASRTTGTGGATSPVTRATGRACPMPGSSPRSTA